MALAANDRLRAAAADAFGRVGAMRAARGAASIRCVFYVPPLGPPVMAAFQLNGTPGVFIKWKRRIAAFGGVVDFSRPGTPFWEVGQGYERMVYWVDTGHYLAEDVALILAGLRAAVECQSVEPAAYLTDAEVDRQAAGRMATGSSGISR